MAINLDHCLEQDENLYENPDRQGLTTKLNPLRAGQSRCPQARISEGKRRVFNNLQ